ncbi:MAG: GWxTD domain-containing protein [Balneolaceae bacterium]
MKIYFFSFLFLLCSLTNASAQGGECEQWLNEGLNAEANGDYLSGLEIWVNSRSVLNEPCPSISFEYIRLTTEQKLKDYYPMAHSMYLWALTTENLAAHHEAIKTEIDRLAPIMPPEMVKNLQKLMERNDPALLERIILFWDDSRLTSAPSYNERLLEHWERISNVREHFNKDSQLPYGTDDRGSFYVRFGEPDHKAQIDLTIKPEDINNILSMSEVREFNERFPRFTTEAGSPFNYNPIIEVWRYDKNEDFISEFVLLFNRNGDGSYRYLRTIDDLIKNSSFSVREIINGRSNGLTPGVVMQAILYDKLKFTANVFADRASSLNFEINSIRREQEQVNITRAGLPLKMQNQTQAVAEMGNAPLKTSTYLKQIPEIPVEFFQYRMIDEEGKPVFTTFIESRPMEALILDVAANQNVMTEDEIYDDNLTVFSADDPQIM